MRRRYYCVCWASCRARPKTIRCTLGIGSENASTNDSLIISGSRLKQKFWYSSVNTAWFCDAYSRCRYTPASRRHLRSAHSNQSIPRTRTKCGRRISSLSRGLKCGTVCLLNCELRTIRWIAIAYIQKQFRLFCLTYMYTNYELSAAVHRTNLRYIKC